MTSTKALQLLFAAIVAYMLAVSQQTVGAAGPVISEAQQQPQEGVGLELLSHVGGGLNDMVVDGDLVYAALGYTLAVIELTDSGEPSVVGRSPLQDWRIENVAVDGGVLFAYGIEAVGGAYRRVLLVFDVSDPTSPKRMAAVTDVWPDAAIMPEALHLIDKKLYVTTTDQGIFVFDVGAPSRPALVEVAHATCSSGSDAYVVTSAVTSDHLAIVAWDQGARSFELLMLSATDAGGITLQGRLDLGFVNAGRIAIASGHAYVSTADGLRVIDIRVPANPTRMGLIQETAAYGSVGVVAVTAGTAFVVTIEDPRSGAARRERLAIVDIQDPAAPRFVGYSPIASMVKQLVASEDRLLLSAWQDDVSASLGLRVMDTTDPYSPVVTGQLDTLNTAYRAATTKGGLAVAVGDPPMSVVKLFDPAQPEMVGTADLFAKNANVVATGDVLFAVTPADDAPALELRAVDLSSPTLPEIAGSTELVPATNCPRGIGIDVHAGTLAVTCRDPGMLWLVNVTDPASMVVLSSVRAPNGAKSVFLTDDLAYVAVTPSDDPDVGGLWIVDISDRAEPVEVSLTDFRSGVHDVAVRGGYALLAAGREGLRVVDVGDPEIAAQVDIHHGCWATTFSTVESTLYVSSSESGWHVGELAPPHVCVFDVRSPAAPRLVGFEHLEVNGDILGVDDLLLVSAFGRGLMVLGQLPGPLPVAPTPHPTIWYLATDTPRPPTPTSSITPTATARTEYQAHLPRVVVGWP